VEQGGLLKYMHNGEYHMYNPDVIGALQAAAARGIRVPDDLSVVGFDDSPLAARVRPSLTTVRQPVVEKGHAAAAALTAAIEQARSGTKSRARHIVLNTTLVVRDSTAPPRPAGAPRSRRRTASLTRS